MKVVKTFKYGLLVLAGILFLVALPQAEGNAENRTSSAQIALRQHLISFLQIGSELGDLPPNHALYPLQRTPLIATTAYLLMGHDPSMLRRFYPDLSRQVTVMFQREHLTAEGFVPGVTYGLGRGTVHVSPAMNVIANLELQSLHLIAGRIGAYEDALELRAWSQSFARSITAAFYHPSRDAFFPIDRDGRFMQRYMPEQLLPLLADRDMSERTRGRITENFLYKRRLLAGMRGLQVREESLWNNPLSRPVIYDLLAGIPMFASRIAAMTQAGFEVAATGETPRPAHTDWLTFWNNLPGTGERLYPSWEIVSSLVHLVMILERDELVDPQELAPLRTDVDSLVGALTACISDLDAYIEAIATVNRLLTGVSKFSASLEAGWVLRPTKYDRKWNRLSPRTRRLITGAAVASIDELMRAKAALSADATTATGIVTEVRFPERLVPLGTQKTFEAYLWSAGDTIEISRFYLQIEDTRWQMTEHGERVTLVPGTAPLTFTKPLPLSPAKQPGVYTFNAYFDLAVGGRRVEIHHVENVCLAKTQEVSLSFPEGRKLSSEKLPVKILVKFQPDHDIQGIVGGEFLKEIACSPELPARFKVQKNAEMTTLPLELRPIGLLTPGRYPFGLTITLDGRRVGSFEEFVVRPFRWIHLGPLTNTRHVLSSGTEYQDDLFKRHRTVEGRETSWEVVPAGAVDGTGSVHPDRLYGVKTNSCMLLYTALDSPGRLPIRWTLETAGDASLWINSDRLLGDENTGTPTATGTVELRKGFNSILIATSWTDRPGHVLFEMSDASGLPIAGISNEIDKIVDGFDRLASDAYGDVSDGEPSGRPREIEITLENSEASDVCVIGSFNNWEAGTTPMERDANGVWRAKVLLPPGRYTYKFLINKKVKVTDPASKLLEADGFGGMNSILLVK